MTRWVPTFFLIVASLCLATIALAIAAALSSRAAAPPQKPARIDRVGPVRTPWDAKGPPPPPDHNRIGMWDTASGKLLRWFVGHQGPVRRVALSRDGRRLVSVGDDNSMSRDEHTARTWDVGSGKEL